jgi:site-specific DNA-cytosine methylase
MSLEGVPVGLETQERNLGPLGVHVVKSDSEWAARIKDLKGEVTLCMGAPPCHGFASTNTARGDSAKARGSDHVDNVCMSKFARAAAAIGPPVAAFDMVPGFLSAGLPVLKKLRRIYGRAGYAMTVVVTQGKDVGLGQSRKRLMVIAHRLRIRVPRVDPVATPAKAWLSDLTSQPLHVGPMGYAASPLTAQQRWARQASYTAWGDEPATPLRRVVCEHDVSDHNFDDLCKWASEHGFKSLRAVPAKIIDKLGKAPRGGRPGWSGISRWEEHAPCVTGSSKTYHPINFRKMTAREAARLMSYPDWYCFLGEHGGKVRKAYGQVGKAVPPLLAMEAALYLLASIEEARPLRDRDLERVLVIRRDRFPHETYEWEGA